MEDRLESLKRRMKPFWIVMAVLSLGLLLFGVSEFFKKKPGSYEHLLLGAGSLSWALYFLTNSSRRALRWVLIAVFFVTYTALLFIESSA